MIAPPRLRPGDTIGIVAPSGPVQRGPVLAGARALEQAGFRVRFARHLYDKRGHLAGSDAARAADLNRMLADPDVRCVLMARGGYGLLRLAPEVDWAAMRRDPKIYAGFSDATFLHLGFARHAGVRTLHGPNLQGLKGSDARRWLAWVTQPKPGETVRTLRARSRLAGGRAVVGNVLGGNLTLVHYAIGIGTLPSLKNAILFLEEVNEPPYKVDGMLTHLGLAGALRGVRGVALGDFTKCVPRPHRRELPLREVLADHLEPLGGPILTGIRAGHGPRNVPLPLGARAVLDPHQGALIYEEGLVS
ncbi:MAG TPA: LD-carboxypeptidase [Candidatus Eisenbacteria bacterium]|nr:LD-carboxypeptidase [Candidatus Eisenbacteria bacterium]